MAHTVSHFAKQLALVKNSLPTAVKRWVVGFLPRTDSNYAELHVKPTIALILLQPTSLQKELVKNMSKIPRYEHERIHESANNTSLEKGRAVERQGQPGPKAVLGPLSVQTKKRGHQHRAVAYEGAHTTTTL